MPEDIEPLALPYSYERLDPLDSNDLDGSLIESSYPLVVYFDREEDRAAFCQAIKAAMDRRGYQTDHLT
jgi:hypothetical protein